MAVTPRGIKERRDGPDGWSRSLKWFATIGWVLLIIALFLLAYAKPETETFFDRANNLSVRTSWNMQLAQLIYLLLCLGLLTSITGLLINFKRKRRRNEGIRDSLVVMALASLLGIVLYQISF